MAPPAISPPPARRVFGMTLVEVALALTILSLALGGVLAALVQSRRLTEGSVAQNSALTIVQGYVEQMKNMELKDVVNAAKDPASGGSPSLGASFAIPTRFKEPPTDGTTDYGKDALWTSTGTPPSLSSLTPGVTPGGGAVVDNLKDFSDNSGMQGAASIWATTWPGKQNNPDAATVTAPTATPYPGDLHLNMWVWVQDLSGTTANAAQVYSITTIYTWQFRDGNKIRYVMGTVRTIRSAVPSF